MKTYPSDSCVLEQVIISTNGRRGRGTESDPQRVITQIWSTSGELIAEHDPYFMALVAEGNALKNDQLRRNNE